jgi:hypothetical protein
LHFDASARQAYEFGDRASRSLAYRVLLSAIDESDLVEWLHHDELLGLWPDLCPAEPVRTGEHAVAAMLHNDAGAARSPFRLRQPRRRLVE